MLSKKIKKLIVVTAMVFTLLFSAVNIAHAQTTIKPFRLPESAITYYVKQEVSKPKVLIYHTHYCETYADGTNVYDAGEDLAAKLEKKGIVVEHIDIDFSKDYNNAYYYSRQMLLNKDLSKYALVIDLHRDFNTKADTVDINGRSVAKAMFVSTKENPNRDKELKIVEGIMDNTYGDLYKPVYEKYYEGIKYYNADLSPNTLLLELGNLHNTLGEVKNTNTYLSQAIADYIYNK